MGAFAKPTNIGVGPKPENHWILGLILRKGEFEPEKILLVGGVSPTHLKNMIVKLERISPREVGETLNKYLSCHHRKIAMDHV